MASVTIQPQPRGDPTVFGYHGTSGQNATSILSAGFHPSANEHDWLGDGAYFFEDGPLQARDWARRLYPADPAVLCAEILLNDCLDLKDSAGWARVLTQAHDLYVGRSKRAGIPLPRQSSGAHRLDRAVINLTIEILEREGLRIRAVRGIFAEGAPAFPASFLSELSHVQIAVRDMSLITSLRRVEDAELESLSQIPRELPRGGSNDAGDGGTVEP